MLPDVHGLITTGDGAKIVFDLHGRTVFNRDGSQGGQGLVGWFESEDERYTWLNDAICVAEGTILPDSNRIEIHVYEAINELIAG